MATSHRRYPIPSLRALSVVVMACAGLGGCPSVGPTHGDGGMVVDADTTSSVELGFRVENDNALDWSLVDAEVGVAALRLQSDLGGSADLIVSDLGVVSLRPDSERVVGEVPPATYSQATLTLDSAGSVAAWEFEFTRSSGQRLVVRSNRGVTVESRCDAPTSTEPENSLHVRFTLDGAGLLALVDGAGVPVGTGTTTLDETSAPALVASLEAYLESGFALGCSAD